MRKVQVLLREDQKAALESISARTGQTQSDLIRGGVDLLIDRTRDEDAGWREATRAAAGIWKDRPETLPGEFRAAAKRRFSSFYSQE